MMKAWKICIGTVLGVFLLLVLLFYGCRAFFPRPYRDEVQASGIDPSLIYAVVKTESNFDEKAVSRAGAVGLMQLMPATAQFICDRAGLVFDQKRLTDGAYNLKLGCLYLKYLIERFPVRETALAAYNAGEGTVKVWLADANYSADGKTLSRIPYPETENYLKKITKIKNFYDFFY